MKPRYTILQWFIDGNGLHMRKQKEDGNTYDEKYVSYKKPESKRIYFNGHTWYLERRVMAAPAIEGLFD